MTPLVRECRLEPFDQTEAKLIQSGSKGDFDIGPII